MLLLRICAAVIFIYMSSTANETEYREPCVDVDIEITTLQTHQCTETILRLGSVSVLINQICGPSSSFQNAKIAQDVSFDTENDFFDTQQALASSLLWNSEPEPFNVSLRYLLNFHHDMYLFFLSIDGILVSIYNGSAVSYCDLNVLPEKNLGIGLEEYARGRGLDKLKSKSSELQTKWENICKVLDIHINRTVDMDITKCVSHTESTTPAPTNASSAWPNNDNISLDGERTCGLLPIVAIVAIVSVTVIAVAILLVIRKRLGSIENRYHKELSKYWL